MSKMIKVWVGKGVLWHGRKKIGSGDEIPSDLSADVLKSLTAKGFIKEVEAGEAVDKSADAKPKKLDDEKPVKAASVSKDKAKPANG